MRDTKVDMLHGPLAGKLFWFALPIAASSMLQQLFNAADTAVVGKFADAAALAAVGTNGEIVAFIVSLSAGLAVGTNVLLGMCIGKGEKKDIQGVIQIAMVLALAVGLVGLLLGQVVARPILVLIHTPEEILDLAVQYLRIYCLGYPALLVYDFGSAILRSKGDSRRPFLILTFSGFINVGLNLFFVIVCGLGACRCYAGHGIFPASRADDHAGYLPFPHRLGGDGFPTGADAALSVHRISHHLGHHAGADLGDFQACGLG